MKNRVALLILGLVGLLWITYISFDLLKIDSQPNYLTYFNESDQRVIVIHDWREIDRNTDNIVLPPSNEAIINSLASKINSVSFYVSVSRPVVVIERKDNWGRLKVESLFKNGIYPFQWKGSHRFSFGKFSGNYAKNQLILHACDISESKTIFQVDRKATYSTVSFLAGGTEVCDVFKKLNATYFYKKTKIGLNSFRKHDDKKLFASVIPDKFESYSFFDKEYLASTEPIFKNSSFQNWVDQGIVILRNNNRSLAIFDFKEGQSPIQNLNEKLNKTELNEEFSSYQDVSFSSLIHAEGNNELYVAESDGFCLVSHQKDFLDEVLTEIKLGHSLSQNEEKTAQVYRDLPKKVTARIIDSTQTKAVSIIGYNRHEIAFAKNDLPKEQEGKKDRDYFAMNPGEKVIDFAAFNERGNVIALTESNKIVGYINGLKKWEKQFSGEVTLKSCESNKKYICVFNKNECQLIDMFGKIQFRFTSIRNVSPELYTLKNKEEFLVATSENSFSLLNGQGSTIKQFSCVGKIKDLLVRNSNNTAMVLTDNMLYSIDLGKRKSVSKIAVDSLYQLVKDQNGLYAVSYSQGNLNTIDSKGKKTSYSIGNFSPEFTAVSENSGATILFKKQKSLFAFDIAGKRKWSKNFPVSEITKLSGYENAGKLLVVLLDGIENELYLLNGSGSILDNSSKHGEQKIDLSGFGARGFSITTFLGNYLIQYNK